MPLNTKFSLTPLEPFKYLWDYTNSCYFYYASLSHFGVRISPGVESLERFYAENKVYLRCNTVDYPFPDPLPIDFYEHAVGRLYFCTDAPTNKCHLLLFHVNCWYKIGVYLNGNLVQEKDCKGDETIAVLVDSPGPGVFDSICIVPQHDVWIKGVDCYVL